MHPFVITEIDEFVYKWHFAFRVTNLISVILRRQAIDFAKDLLNEPEKAIVDLTEYIGMSSQFFLCNILVSGMGNLIELSQLQMIFRYLMRNKFITIDASSKRDVEKMREPISMDWGTIIPPFIFALLIASLYR